VVTDSFGNQKYMQPVGRLKHALKVPCFYFILSFGWGGAGRIFFIFPLFSTCSFYVPFKFSMGTWWEPQCVPNVFPKFPMCSPRVLPIAPCFNPFCFAQSPPPLTKGGGTPSLIESSILGEPPQFQLFLQWANQNNSLQKKRLDLWSTPS
jgi:hypothetical protein